jgi:hypothetical protein
MRRGDDTGHREGEARHAGFLRRAKEIASGFEAVAEGAGAPRTALALLENPVHVYDDPERGVDKGVVLAWCHGKNPEALVCIEFYADSRTSVELTKLANAGVTLEGHGRTWATPQGPGDPRGPYWSFVL